MSPALRHILTGNGSFPERDQTVAAFEAALRIADEGHEPAADVAETLIGLIDQLAVTRDGPPAAIAERIALWAKQAAADPGVSAAQVVSLLVNAGTPTALATLEAFAKRADGSELAAIAAEGAAELTAA